MENQHSSTKHSDGMEIDCFQNLLIMQCQQQKLDTLALYVLWPWEFRCNLSDIAKVYVELTDVVDATKLKEYYNVELKQHFYDDSNDLLKAIELYIQNQLPVIVSADQFYIPYHYQHIYGVEHGLHSILLHGMNDKENINCVSSIPRYSGVVLYGHIQKAISSNSVKHWYATVLFDHCQQVDMHTIWCQYRKKLNRFLELDMDNSICCTEHIRCFLIQLVDASEEERINGLTRFCKGNWGWHITRRGAYLSKLLDVYQNKKKTSFDDLIQMIQSINEKWQLAYKLLYMESCTYKLFKRPISILRNIVEEEKNLDLRLLEIPKDYFV